MAEGFRNFVFKRKLHQRLRLRDFRYFQRRKLQKLRQPAQKHYLLLESYPRASWDGSSEEKPRNKHLNCPPVIHIFRQIVD